MAANPEFVKELILKIFVQPRASRNEVAGRHGDAIKIRLTAPPVDGAANKMCIKFLSKWLNVPKSSMEIVAGDTGRTKLVKIRFDTMDEPNKARERVQQLIATS